MSNTNKSKEVAVEYVGRNCEYINQNIEGIIFGYCPDYVWIKITKDTFGPGVYREQDKLKYLIKEYNITILITINENDAVIGVCAEDIHLLEGGITFDKQVIQELIDKLDL